MPSGMRLPPRVVGCLAIGRHIAAPGESRPSLLAPPTVRRPLAEARRAGGRAACRLHCCTHSRERTAFLRRLQPHVKRGSVIVHHDHGEPGRGLDIAALLAEPTPGRHVYACGPHGFMEAVKASVGAWPPHAVHFEYFHAVALTEQEAAWDQVPFKIRISRTGELIDVPANCSIVKALRGRGIDIEASCEEGYCGTCITRCLAGDPVHRDSVPSESERKTLVMVCRAR